MLIGGIAAAVIIIFLIALFNNLVAKKANVENAFAGIDVQLKKRCDLIPNLVSSVKAYMTHEAGVLENLTLLRSQAQAASSPEERIRLDRELSSALRGLMVQVEAYPNLKASDNMIQLQRTLNEIEEQISAARRAYNAAVTAFNVSIRIFPNNIFAGILGYTAQSLFETAAEDRKTPDVGGMFRS